MSVTSAAAQKALSQSLVLRWLTIILWLAAACSRRRPTFSSLWGWRSHCRQARLALSRVGSDRAGSSRFGYKVRITWSEALLSLLEIITSANQYSDHWRCLMEAHISKSLWPLIVLLSLMLDAVDTSPPSSVHTPRALSPSFLGFWGSADSFQDAVRVVGLTSWATFPGFLWGSHVFRGKSVLCLFYLLLLRTQCSTPGGKGKQKHLEREPHLHPLHCLTLAYSKVSDILTHTSFTCAHNVDIQ